MPTCEQCLFQNTKKEIEGKGSCVFCLVKGNWNPTAKKCGQYRESDSSLSADTARSLAFELRQEEAENRRLRAVVKSTRVSMILSLIIAFILFIAVTKFYDKFLF
ncbi:MAG: hypothetical protein A2293_00620 [Elusimicrobia bacterium RIFOXYB2_FULL_49_7]|nr:MAG: hypothetical protein A2293_00620 [Elusimicrobia bacterium RIFOXYB2_FULL_49_7]